MEEYIIILDIVKQVIKGLNLSDTFNLAVQNLNNSINISKIKDITYGICRYYYRLNAILNKLVKNNNYDDIVKVLLLIVFYELNYTKKPSYSVVNTIVNLSYFLFKKQQIKNFINAVSRNYIRQKVIIDNEIIQDIEVKYNLPSWWIENLSRNNVLDEIEPQLFMSNLLPKICLRVNPRKTNIIKYQEILIKHNIEYSLIDMVIVLNNTMPVVDIPYFNEGYVSIQNISAQHLIKLIPSNFLGRVLDACSAPGGKLSQILENFDVEVDAIDIDQNRLSKVSNNLSRLGLKANLYCVDATDTRWFIDKKYSLIIADVPCSASGTIKTNPDIKINRRRADINKFVAIQRQIFDNLVQFITKNGYIIYITCSIFSEENQDNIKYFLEKYPFLTKINEKIISIDDIHDGFYYCVLQSI